MDVDHLAATPAGQVVPVGRQADQSGCPDAKAFPHLAVAFTRMALELSNRRIIAPKGFAQRPQDAPEESR